MAFKLSKIKTHDPALGKALLRVGLGLVFLYAAIATFTQPFEWAGYVPTAVLHVAPVMLVLRIMAIYELLLSIGLLSGLYVRYTSMLCTLTLGAIVIANPSQFVVTFRDLGLAFASLALFLLS